MNNQLDCTIECLFKSRYEFKFMHFGLIKICDGYRLYRKLRISVPSVVSCRNVINFIIPYHNASGVGYPENLCGREKVPKLVPDKKGPETTKFISIFFLVYEYTHNSTSKRNFRTKNLHIRPKICN